MYTGKQIFMETLVAENVDYIFGNPGTTELPLIDALLDYPQISYIMALHEAVAVSMADAYAHASGQVAVVNLHVAPGLGNGLGSVYNAWEGQTPMVVTAGQQNSKLRLREPLLGHDLVAMAAPVVKWSVQAESADELPLIMNRAFKTAREAPSGPVFVSLPMNVMEQKTHNAPIAPSTIYHRVHPDTQGLEVAAQHLVTAENPVIVFGDKIAASGANTALVELAENIGARVYAEILPSRLSFPNQHPCFKGRLPQDHAQIRAQIGDADVVLLAGGEFFEEIWYADESPFGEQTVRIQIDPSPVNMARNHRVDCGLIADPQVCLTALSEAVDALAADKHKDAAAERMMRLTDQKEAEWEQQMGKARTVAGNKAMSAARLMVELSASLPANVAVSGEPITSGLDMLRTLSFNTPSDYLAARGGGIGQGLPSTIGMKLAMPDRPVLCLSGDGSAMYTIQALWTAVHHDIPVVFLILNNGAYRILKLNMNRYRKESKLKGRGYQHLDLAEPQLDFVALAKGMGVEATRIENPEDVGPAIKRAFESNQPWVLDVVIDGSI